MFIDRGRGNNSWINSCAKRQKNDSEQSRTWQMVQNIKKAK